jgi:DNA-binding transcriptional regulator LsrR (DeoR family)
MVDAFEMIMDKIDDRRLRIIVRNYYALGWTDERIAEQLELSRQHVNRLRTAYIEQLQ